MRLPEKWNRYTFPYSSSTAKNPVHYRYNKYKSLKSGEKVDWLGTLGLK